MRRLIIATKNSGKVKEIKSLLQGYEYEVLSLEEAGVDIDVEENGSSFEENSLIKAMAIHKITGDMVVADDSGLEIDFLNSAPGIYSARFLNCKNDKKRYEGVLALMNGISEEYRSARFKCAVSLVTEANTKTFTGIIEGKIAYKAEGENGFGYDPIFYIPEYKKTMAQIDSELKNHISHRGLAFKQLAETLKKMENKMKLYLVISDTHGDLFAAKKVIAQYPQIDGLIHLGDYYKDANIIKAQNPGLNVIMLPGNCDLVYDVPSDLILELEGKRILLTHGHLYNVKSGIERLERKAIKENIDLVFFGHTHCPLQEKRMNITFVNPGSLGYPRDHSIPTYALFEISKNGFEIRVLEV